MMGLRTLHRRLRDDERGAYIVEFALIIVPLIVILFASIDLAYRSYMGAVIEGTLHRAARRATVGNQTEAQIDTYIRSQLGFFSKRGTVTIEKSNYYDYSGVGKPEKIKQDTAPLGMYNAGDCFEDLNGNGSYDSIAGRTGLGGSDDIVYYKVSVTYPRFVPLGKFLGWSNNETVSANSVLRNQPYASQIVPTVICT